MNIEDPYMWLYWGFEEPSNSQHVKERKKYGSSRNAIWKAPQISGIHLEELALDCVVPSFLDYLASYSGLKKLQLTAGGFLDGTSSDTLARQFFSTPLTNHVHSLEELRVIPPFEGSWCFGGHNEAVLSRFTNLKTLRMAILSEQLAWQGVSPDNLEGKAERNLVVSHSI
jgi:hypothetical protein